MECARRPREGARSEEHLRVADSRRDALHRVDHVLLQLCACRSLQRLHVHLVRDLRERLDNVLLQHRLRLVRGLEQPLHERFPQAVLMRVGVVVVDLAGPRWRGGDCLGADAARRGLLRTGHRSGTRCTALCGGWPTSDRICRDRGRRRRALRWWTLALCNHCSGQRNDCSAREEKKEDLCARQRNRHRRTTLSACDFATSFLQREPPHRQRPIIRLAILMVTSVNFCDRTLFLAWEQNQFPDRNWGMWSNLGFEQASMARMELFTAHVAPAPSRSRGRVPFPPVN